MQGWTPFGLIVAGAIVGGAISYFIGAIRQYQGKDKWIVKLVDKFE